METFRVLIVDDEKNIRLGLSEAIADMDLFVETASDGVSALEAMERQDFSLVLLDLRMPGMDGMEVLRRLNDDRPDVKVVIITAHGSVPSAVEAMKLGAVDFLAKPYTPREVRTLVTRIMTQEAKEAGNAERYESLVESARKAIRRREAKPARRYVLEALRLDPMQPEAHNLMGILREIAGERFEAQQCYRKALETDPSYAPALANLRESVEPDRKTSFFLGEAKIRPRVKRA